MLVTRQMSPGRVCVVDLRYGGAQGIFFKTKRRMGQHQEKKSEMRSDPRCYRDKKWPLHKEKGGQILCSVVSGLMS